MEEAMEQSTVRRRQSRGYQERPLFKRAILLRLFGFRQTEAPDGAPDNADPSGPALGQAWHVSESPMGHADPQGKPVGSRASVAEWDGIRGTGWISGLLCCSASKQRCCYLCSRSMGRPLTYGRSVLGTLLLSLLKRRWDPTCCIQMLPTWPHVILKTTPSQQPISSCMSEPIYRLTEHLH